MEQDDEEFFVPAIYDEAPRVEPPYPTYEPSYEEFYEKPKYEKPKYVTGNVSWLPGYDRQPVIDMAIIPGRPQNTKTPYQKMLKDYYKHTPFFIKQQKLKKAKKVKKTKKPPPKIKIYKENDIGRSNYNPIQKTISKKSKAKKIIGTPHHPHKYTHKTVEKIKKGLTHNQKILQQLYIPGEKPLLYKL